MAEKRKWTIDNSISHIIDVVDEMDYVVCEHVGGMDYAHLIAAAPDLYEALDMAVLWLEFDGKYDVLGMKAALAKARGE